jgi:hypothetical protein
MSLSDDVKFTKSDADKVRWRFLPLSVIRDVASVLDFGATKYGDDNWKRCDDWNRYYDALMRHIYEWRSGVQQDEDTGKHPLIHAICCLIFLAWKETNNE